MQGVSGSWRVYSIFVPLALNMVSFAGCTAMTAATKPLPGPDRPAFAIRVLRRLWRLAVDRSHRKVTWLNLMRPKGVFQPFSVTFENRYPQIFSFVQAQLGAESDVRLLSFGCSTGEEVYSLRKYFPRAFIKGIDVNSVSIAACRRRLALAPDAALAFETASSTAAEPAASYDAIFCMAVMRHGSLGNPGVTRCDHLIRFEDFAQAAADFERCLKPGGLLIIRHSNFRLCDAPAGASFETIQRLQYSDKVKATPIFGPDNRLIEGVKYFDTVFRKQSR